ncbi:MAG: ISNCY family transposase [Anaerolineales bacterium]
MSEKELTRLEVMQRLKEKRLLQKEAAVLLGLSVRQVKRVWRKYRKQAAKGLVSAKRGKASNHRLDAGVVQQALDLVKKKYSDFGPTLAHEKLVEAERIEISRESVRKIMIEEGLWKPRRKKKEQVHQMRERRACFGELIQIDGSDHAWFEERGERCTLLVFIDDATGQLVELLFVEAETFFAYCEAARHYVEREGKPLAFYSDKHGVFRVNTTQALGTTSGLTQFGRAMQELDIQIICANSPQAKGRVEPANQTLQDRLVKELRLRNLSTIETANAYLEEFRADFNRRFAVPARSTHDAHRPLLPTENLDRIFTHQRATSLSKNLTLQYNKIIYQIQTDRPTYTLHNAPVLICENTKGEVSILYQNKPLAYTTYKTLARQSEIVDTKHLNRAVPLPKPPAANHLWRTYGTHLNGQPIQETTPRGSD